MLLRRLAPGEEFTASAMAEAGAVQLRNTIRWSCVGLACRICVLPYINWIPVHILSSVLPDQLEVADVVLPCIPSLIAKKKGNELYYYVVESARSGTTKVLPFQSSRFRWVFRSLLNRRLRERQPVNELQSS